MTKGLDSERILGKIEISLKVKPPFISVIKEGGVLKRINSVER